MKKDKKIGVIIVCKDCFSWAGGPDYQNLTCCQNCSSQNIEKVPVDENLTKNLDRLENEFVLAHPDKA